jgi:hypothetical protein
MVTSNRIPYTYQIQHCLDLEKLQGILERNSISTIVFIPKSRLPTVVCGCWLEQSVLSASWHSRVRFWCPLLWYSENSGDDHEAIDSNAITPLSIPSWKMTNSFFMEISRSILFYGRIVSSFWVTSFDESMAFWLSFRLCTVPSRTGDDLLSSWGAATRYC